jgi:hypothetical protein
MKCDWTELPKIPKAVVGDSTPVRKPKILEAFVHEAALVMDEVAAPIDYFHGKVVNTSWNVIAKVTKPFRTAVSKFALPVFIFGIVVFVFHLPLILALLAASGLTIMGLLRTPGLIGPKRLDKDGKEIDDIF